MESKQMAPAQDTTARSSAIQHVVVLTLENRSFDRMLGALKAVYPRMQGVDPASPRTNADHSGTVFSQVPNAGNTVKPDPMHETANVLRQLGNDQHAPGGPL
jgi:phospholipase C